MKICKWVLEIFIKRGLLVLFCWYIYVFIIVIVLILFIEFVKIVKEKFCRIFRMKKNVCKSICKNVLVYEERIIFLIYFGIFKMKFIFEI